MRLALVAFGTRGDVQPLLALGCRALDEGHDVVVGASESFGDWVRAHGLEFQVVGLDIESILRRHADVIDGNPARSLRLIVSLLREDIDVSFDQTFAMAEGADVLVSGVHAAAPTVAEALGIPHRTLLYSPQALRSHHHPPPGWPWFSMPRLCNSLMWGLLSHGMDVAFGDVINRHRRRRGLRPVDGVMSHLVGCDPIVASDAALGELPADVPLGIPQTGSLELFDDEPLDPALERFLEHGEPPVAIGFGSMPDRDPRRTTTAIVEGIAASGRRGVIVSGWAKLGKGGVPPGIFVARSAPYPALFSRVAVAVHHGGAGTTATAARAGVPQIIVPHAADQFYWGDQIHRRGLGSRPISRRALNGERLAEAIRFVLANPDIAQRARATQEALQRSNGVSTLMGLLDLPPVEREALRLAA